jgi:hypothetical protein
MKRKTAFFDVPTVPSVPAFRSGEKKIRQKVSPTHETSLDALEMLVRSGSIF